MKTHLTKVFRYLRDKLYPVLGFIRFAFIPRNKTLAILLPTVIGVAVFVYGRVARAVDFGDMILGFVNRLLFLIAYALGWLAMKIFALVIWVASYNDIVTSPAVTKGWVLIRDTCNMMFVVMLLIIAFSQILGVQKYSMKSMLLKVVLAAVLVNFSKLVCGLIIDFGQVVMLTFVNGFKATAGANLLVGLGLTRLLKMNDDVSSDNASATSGPTASQITLAMVLAIFMIICVIFVSFFIAVMLVMRIVTLWILVVISPIAFMGNILPFSTKQFSKWWSDFGSNVAVGPVLAFFLWLSLLIMSNPDEMMPASSTADKTISAKAAASGKPGEPSSAAYVGNIAQFAIALAMLVAGLKIASEVSGGVGAIAGKAQQWGAAAAKGAAYRMTGAKAVVDRGRAIGQGWSAQAKVKQDLKMASYGRLGTRAFGAKEKGVSTMAKAVPGTLQAAGSAMKQARKSYLEVRKGAGGAAPPGTVGASLRAAMSGAGKGAAAGWEHERKHGRFGSIGAQMAANSSQTANADQIKEAEKKSKLLGTDNKEDRKKLLNNPAAVSGDRKNAAIQMAAKGEFTNKEEVAKAKSMLKGDRESIKTLDDGLKKKQAHLLDKETFESGLETEDINLSTQGKEFYENGEALATALNKVGVEEFTKAMKAVKGTKEKENMKKVLSGSDGKGWNVTAKDANGVERPEDIKPAKERRAANAAVTGNLAQYDNSHVDSGELAATMDDLTQDQKAKLKVKPGDAKQADTVATAMDSGDLKAMGRGAKQDKELQASFNSLISALLAQANKGKSSSNEDEKTTGDAASQKLTELAADSTALQAARGEAATALKAFANDVKVSKKKEDQASANAAATAQGDAIAGPIIKGLQDALGKMNAPAGGATPAAGGAPAVAPRSALVDANGRPIQFG